MSKENFRMGFFGRMPFTMEKRKELFEKWSTMTDAEKVEFMNKRMEDFNNRNRECENFFDERFTVAGRDRRAEEWLKKTPEEKEAFINEKKAAVKDRFNKGFFRRGFRFGGREHCFFEKSETQTDEE